MTEAEIRAKEKDLANLEEELQSYAREIQERDRAESDIDRTDYLFDAINKHQLYKPPVVVVEPTVRAKVDSPLDCLTAVMATLAAVFTLTILVLILV